MDLARTIDLVPELAAILLPPPERSPDQFADECRKLTSSAERGRYDSSRTAYLIEPQRAMVQPGVKGVVVIGPGQSGKTDVILNVLGHRAKDAPVPAMYVGPSRDFVEDEFSPRLVAMLRSDPELWARVANREKLKRTRIVISGVDIRMAWGSAKRLAGFPAGIAAFDERDQAKINLEHQGDPLEMVKARGTTYPGFRYLIVSTITTGTVTTYNHPETGLEHWEVADPRDVQSPTWKDWQEGTREERAWPCPSCGEYWIPRFKHLRWPEKATPDEAVSTAWVVCPICKARIPGSERAGMCERARYVSPGQRIEKDGTVVGNGVQSSIRSFWYSGLVTAWSSFGGLAADWIAAVRSGEQGRVQGVLNLKFNELYAVRGEAPKSEVIADRRRGYRQGEVPTGVRIVTAGVDPGKDRFHFAIRGWGAQMTSWLLMHGVIWGDTDAEDAYQRLAYALHTAWGERDLPIRLMLVDSGWKPGARWRRPEHRIYDFARRFPGWVRPSKGHDVLEQPVKLARIDYTIGNQKIPGAVELVHVNTDHMKSWIHGRLEWPLEEPGAWHLPIDADDEYCAHMVSESRLMLATGRAKWIEHGPNHYFDCEVLALAAAWMLGVPLMHEQFDRQLSPMAAPEQGQPVIRSKWLGR